MHTTEIRWLRRLRRGAHHVPLPRARTWERESLNLTKVQRLALLSHGCDKNIKGIEAASVVLLHSPALQVERVRCRREGDTLSGVLHLTAHHLIYEHDARSEEELWVR